MQQEDKDNPSEIITSGKTTNVNCCTVVQMETTAKRMGVSSAVAGLMFPGAITVKVIVLVC